MNFAKINFECLVKNTIDYVDLLTNIRNNNNNNNKIMNNFEYFELGYVL